MSSRRVATDSELWGLRSYGQVRRRSVAPPSIAIFTGVFTPRGSSSHAASLILATANIEPGTVPHTDQQPNGAALMVSGSQCRNAVGSLRRPVTDERQ